jgi:hypothetical protein
MESRATPGSVPRQVRPGRSTLFAAGAVRDMTAGSALYAFGRKPAAVAGTWAGRSQAARAAAGAGRPGLGFKRPVPHPPCPDSLLPLARGPQPAPAAPRS